MLTCDETILSLFCTLPLLGHVTITLRVKPLLIGGMIAVLFTRHFTAKVLRIGLSTDLESTRLF